MADTQRTRSQILTLFADNNTGQISPQDLRDWVVTVQEVEFANPGDFWSDPQAKYTTTDKTARGWIMYSQYVGSDCSWMNIMHIEASTGYWMRANVSDSTQNGFLALAMDSYTSDTSTAQMLIRGLVYDSSFSTVFSELKGRPVYLDSGVPGSISVGATGNSTYIIGWIMHSDDHGGSALGKWYFDPAPWAIKGQ
jgi:hypothetical protein